MSEIDRRPRDKSDVAAIFSDGIRGTVGELVELFTMNDSNSSGIGSLKSNPGESGTPRVSCNIKNPCPLCTGDLAEDLRRRQTHPYRGGPEYQRAVLACQKQLQEEKRKISLSKVEARNELDPRLLGLAAGFLIVISILLWAGWSLKKAVSNLELSPTFNQLDGENSK